MGDSAPPSSDRRADARFIACYPASLETLGGEGRAALIHDLSESGVLLYVRSTKFNVDDQVRLSLFLGEDGEQSRSATGRVVRVQPMAPGTEGPWLRRVAVHFDQPLPVSADEVTAFKDRAKRLGLTPT
jgi:hypothetical protein